MRLRPAVTPWTHLSHHLRGALVPNLAWRDSL